MLFSFIFSTFRFYTEAFGMKLLRKRDIPEEKYSNAFLGFGPEESHFVVELTYSNAVYNFISSHLSFHFIFLKSIFLFYILSCEVNEILDTVQTFF